MEDRRVFNPGMLSAFLPQVHLRPSMRQEPDHRRCLQTIYKYSFPIHVSRFSSAPPLPSKKKTPTNTLCCPYIQVLISWVYFVWCWGLLLSCLFVTRVHFFGRTVYWWCLFVGCLGLLWSFYLTHPCRKAIPIPHAAIPYLLQATTMDLESDQWPEINTEVTFYISLLKVSWPPRTLGHNSTVDASQSITPCCCCWH